MFHFCFQINKIFGTPTFYLYLEIDTSKPILRVLSPCEYIITLAIKLCGITSFNFIRRLALWKRLCSNNRANNNPRTRHSIMNSIVKREMNVACGVLNLCSLAVRAREMETAYLSLPSYRRVLERPQESFYSHLSSNGFPYSINSQTVAAGVRQHYPPGLRAQ